MTLATLNESDLRARAPSIFADGKHFSRSERYSYIPTIDVIDNLRQHGYVPVSAQQANARVKSGFQRHMIRLRKENWQESAPKFVGDIVPEVLLINAHDGSSTFRLEAGLFRLACTNGLIVRSDASGASIGIRHSGKDLIEAIRSAADGIMLQMPRIIEATERWESIVMTAGQRHEFARQAMKMRYGTETPVISAEQALAVRRNEDEGNTLWRTFNILEENLSKGGIEGAKPNSRKAVTRSLKSIACILNFERNLWEMADTFARQAA